MICFKYIANYILVRVLELVDSANLSFVDVSRERSSRSSDKPLRVLLILD